MRLRSEVEDGINLVLAKHSLDVGWGRDITMLKCEVGSVLEHARIVQRGTVVELVEGYHIVMLGIRER
jgi:hypothetical protein